MATVKLFQGADRRKINKCKGALAAVMARDALALDTTKKRSSISTRTVVLDLSVQEILDATIAINAALLAALDATKTV